MTEGRIPRLASQSLALGRLPQRFRSAIQAIKRRRCHSHPSRAGSRPTRGTSRRLGPPSPGASRPHLGHLTPGQAVPTWGLTREAPGVPQGGPPCGATVRTTLDALKNSGEKQLHYPQPYAKPSQSGRRGDLTHTHSRRRPPSKPPSPPPIPTPLLPPPSPSPPPPPPPSRRRPARCAAAGGRRAHERDGRGGSGRRWRPYIHLTPSRLWLHTCNQGL